MIPQENFITPQVLIIYLNFLETIHHISLLQTSVGFRQETIPGRKGKRGEETKGNKKEGEKKGKRREWAYCKNGCRYARKINLFWIPKILYIFYFLFRFFFLSSLLLYFPLGESFFSFFSNIRFFLFVSPLFLCPFNKIANFSALPKFKVIISNL